MLRIAGERAELAKPILDGFPDLLAEVVHAARSEQARGIGDVLLRRTRLGLLAARELSAEGSPALKRVAAAVGRELGWNLRRRRAELARFHDEALAEGIVVEGLPAGAGAS